jgi:hypothetical protein
MENTAPMEAQDTVSAAVDPSKVPCCRCKDEVNGIHSVFAVEKISKTEKNPGRIFYVCSIPKDKGGCNYFAWADDIIVDSKTGFAKKKYIPMEKKPKAEVASHDETNARCDEFQLKINSLESRIERLEESFASLKNTFNPAATLDELPPAKTQKTTGGSTYSKRGGSSTRPKILQ